MTAKLATLNLFQLNVENWNAFLSILTFLPYVWAIDKKISYVFFNQIGSSPDVNSVTAYTLFNISITKVFDHNDMYNRTVHVVYVINTSLINICIPCSWLWICCYHYKMIINFVLFVSWTEYSQRWEILAFRSELWSTAFFKQLIIILVWKPRNLLEYSQTVRFFVKVTFLCTQTVVELSPSGISHFAFIGLNAKIEKSYQLKLKFVYIRTARWEVNNNFS